MKFLLAALLVGLAVSYPQFPPAHATPPSELVGETAVDSAKLVRLAGPDRYATAGEIAQRWSPGVQVVYIANGTTFTDASVAAAKAGSQDVPVLLTRQSHLPSSTARALEHLQPQRIVVVGNTGKVGRSVERQLGNYAMGEVQRLAGGDGYGTAAAVASTYPAGADAIYLATGEDFADALAGAAAAGHDHSPILYVQQETVPADTTRQLGRIKPRELIVLGGSGAISDDAARAAASSAGLSGFRRVGGSNRYATAALLAREMPDRGAVWVASGATFADSMTGSALAATRGGPVVLVRRDGVPAATREVMDARQPQSVTVFGGTAAISDSTASALVETGMARTREDFPDESSTGVPDGIDLEPSGSVTVEEDGAVVEGLEISGTVTVKADDVVIRNTRILNAGAYPVRVDGGKRLLIEDTEIDGRGRGDAAVAFNNYTLRRVHIHNIPEGPRIAGGNVTIEDSLINQLVRRGNNHTDAVQVVSGSDIVLRGNVLDSHDPGSNILGNAAFMFGEEDGPVTDCLVEDSYLNGGNYTVNGGGGGTDGAACAFRDNVLGRDHRYGAAANIGPQSDWDESNVWVGTHDPARPGKVAR